MEWMTSRLWVKMMIFPNIAEYEETDSELSKFTISKLHSEIERLKEEYIILQNASDEVEEEKDKEIERLNNIINKIKECLSKNRVYITGERNLAFELDDILEGVDKE